MRVVKEMVVNSRIDHRVAVFHFLFEHWQGQPGLIFVTCTSKDFRKYSSVGILFKGKRMSVKIYEPNNPEKKSVLDKRFPLCHVSLNEIESLGDGDIKASISLVTSHFSVPKLNPQGHPLW